MQPWAAEGGYFNFTERPCDVDAILPAEVCARLAEVKRKWDPDGHDRRQPRGLAGHRPSGRGYRAEPTSSGIRLSSR